MFIFVLSVLINLIIWYALLYYLLYAIKNSVNLFVAALILVILTSLAFVTCPFAQPTIESVLIDQGMVSDEELMNEEFMYGHGLPEKD